GRHARCARGGATARTAYAGSAPWRPAAEGGQMTRNRMLNMSERWFRFLQRLYPPDFRDEMGNAVVEAYTDRTRDALTNSGKIHLIALWLRAFVALAAQRRCRAGAPGGLVAARLQLGSRCRARQTAAGALSGLCRNDDWNADHRPRHVRRGLHRGAEGSD